METSKRAAQFRSRSAMATLSCTLFAVSVALRLFAHVYFPANNTSYYLATQILLPLFSCAAFILLILIGSDNILSVSFLALFAGILFFILKAFEFQKTHQILCTALYITVGLIYTLTVTGVTRRKILLILVFALPLVYHIGEDVYNYYFLSKKFSSSVWLMEFSVLAIMAALLCFTLALETRYERDHYEVGEEEEVFDIFSDIPIVPRENAPVPVKNKLADEPVIPAQTEESPYVPESEPLLVLSELKQPESAPDGDVPLPDLKQPDPPLAAPVVLTELQPATPEPVKSLSEFASTVAAPRTEPAAAPPQPPPPADDKPPVKKLFKAGSYQG